MDRSFLEFVTMSDICVTGYMNLIWFNIMSNKKRT